LLSNSYRLLIIKNSKSFWVYSYQILSKLYTKLYTMTLFKLSISYDLKRTNYFICIYLVYSVYSMYSYFNIV
jgi:hypothetical protein